MSVAIALTVARAMLMLLTELLSGVVDLVNARIGIRKDNFTVELFARNLFDDQSPGITDNSRALSPASVVLPGGNTPRSAC